MDFWDGFHIDDAYLEKDIEKSSIYTFENCCKENPKLVFGDETVKIVLNSKGTMADANQELLDFLDYIDSGIPMDDYTRTLDDEVKKVRRNEKWRLDYMTLYLKEQESYMDGKEDGVSEGMEKKALEIAKGLLDILDVPTVAEKTGLSEEVVRELARKE